MVIPTVAQDEEEVKPKPDLWAAEIVAPEGVVFGPSNTVTVIVENLMKDSELEGLVKIELVVIQKGSNERSSYFAEVEGMRHRQKREAVFQGVEVTNKDAVRFLAIVDPEKLVEESNEDNNRKLYQVWVEEPAPSPSPSPAPEAVEEE